MLPPHFPHQPTLYNHQSRSADIFHQELPAIVPDMNPSNQSKVVWQLPTGGSSASPRLMIENDVATVKNNVKSFFCFMRCLLKLKIVAVRFF